VVQATNLSKVALDIQEGVQIDRPKLVRALGDLAILGPSAGGHPDRMGILLSSRRIPEVKEFNRFWLMRLRLVQGITEGTQENGDPSPDRIIVRVTP